MNREHFDLVMHAVDDALLEEAQSPIRHRRKSIWWAIAACLILVLTLPLLRPHTGQVTLSVLREQGYPLALPEQAQNTRYELVSLEGQNAARATFTLGQTEYTCTLLKAEYPAEPEEGSLCWRAGDVELTLLEQDSDTTVRWYADNTQWQLSAHAQAREVLTTASQVLEITGMNVTVAPAEARDITYNAFRMGELTVAETTFTLEGIPCTYRMAATTELREDFSDISGVDEPFAHVLPGEIRWCRAKLSFNEGERGKVIWFDLVPGILYSLSVETDASQELLLELAGALFDPAQDDS